MLLADIVATSGRVAETRARLGKVGHIADCLRRLVPAEIEIGVCFLGGELRQGKIGFGHASLRQIASEPAGAPELELLAVDRELSRIQGMRGPGSKAARMEGLRGLMRRATREEQRFLQRLLIGELRQGALEGIMAEAMAKAAGVAPRDVRRALMLSGRAGEVARAALEHGAAGLARFSLELFRPLQPMLAQTADGVSDALARLEGEAALEWKLDGARIQVHRAGERVRVFTRQLNDVTAAVPEVVEAALRLPIDSIVLDGEALALQQSGRPQPFQVTMRRFGRRLDVARLRRLLPLQPFFFDCLHLDGQDLIDLEGNVRAAALADVLPEDIVIPRLVTGNAAQAARFLQDALAAGHEGIVAKALAATYEAGRRGSGWLKIKPSHTLDLVVLAAEWGSGRRRGWLSNLHLGARDPATGGFAMLGKTFKGMTDRILEWQTKKLQEIEVGRDEWTVHVKPELVVEIAFDGVQASPHYPSGLALRFARLKRYRNDKPAAEADTIDTVRALLFKGV